jgi:hypothetical protein
MPVVAPTGGARPAAKPCEPKEKQRQPPRTNREPDLSRAEREVPLPVTVFDWPPDADNRQFMLCIARRKLDPL